MRPLRFSLGQLLFVLALFPLAVGVAAASSLATSVVHEVLGWSLTQMLRNVIQSGFYVHVITRAITDFIGTTLALATVVAVLTSSRLAPARQFASLVVLAVPVFIGFQEYFFTRDNLKENLLQNLQEYVYYRWDILLVAAGIMGTLWWVRAYVAHRRPAPLNIQEWRATVPTGTKALTGLLMVAILSMAAVGFLWLRELSQIAC